MEKSISKYPCKRCLLRELNEETLLEQVREYCRSVPPKERCSPEAYEERLSVCKDCKWLHQGTCQKCGAFVEARAYRWDAHCPLGEKIW